MKSVTLKVEGSHEGILGYSPFDKMCTNLFPNPSIQVAHNRHLVLKGEKKTTLKLGFICEGY